MADAELQVAQAEATLAEQQDPTADQEAVAQTEIQVTQAEASLADHAERVIFLRDGQIVSDRLNGKRKKGGKL